MEVLRGIFRVSRLFLSGNYIDLNDIANSYTRVSESYNQSFFKEMHKYNEEMLNELIIKFTDKDFDKEPKILDLACGTGFNSEFINSKIHSSNFTLVDISKGMLKEAKRSLNLNAKFIESDMLSFLKGCGDNSFDIVICAWAIKYQNPHKIIKEVNRVLKKGGYFAVIVNLKSTLPEVRKIYPKLIMKNYKSINKLMLELPNPISEKTFESWFKRKTFSMVKIRSGAHIFTFDDTKSLVTFVTSTGALAGFDAVVDMNDFNIKNTMIKLFNEKNINTITHKYVWGIFENDK